MDVPISLGLLVKQSQDHLLRLRCSFPIVSSILIILDFSTFIGLRKKPADGKISILEFWHEISAYDAMPKLLWTFLVRWPNWAKCNLFSRLTLVFVDEKTPRPFVEDLSVYGYEGDGNDIAALNDHIYLDAMGLGMGCCCLQVTFQAQSIDEARFLYDQLTPLTGIMVRQWRLSELIDVSALVHSSWHWVQPHRFGEAIWRKSIVDGTFCAPCPMIAQQKNVDSK